MVSLVSLNPIPLISPILLHNLLLSQLASLGPLSPLRYCQRLESSGPLLAGILVALDYLPMAFLVAPRIVLGLKCLGTLLVGHQEVGHMLGCLKIVYPYTQWLMIIIPIKWLFHWEYTQHFQTNPHVGSISAAKIHGVLRCHQAMGQAKGEARGGGLLARGAWWVSSNEQIQICHPGFQVAMVALVAM